MGTLTDITTHANNVKGPKREPTRLTKTSIALTSHNEENLGNFKNSTPKYNNAPRFMSPTVASKSQAATPVAKVGDQTSTPTSFGSSTAKGRNWVASAVKRVGMRRSGERTPQSEEEVPPGNANGLTGLDEISTIPKSNLQAIATSTTTTKSVLTEKPLPSPPMAQIITTSPVKETRTLIDASEKPLRRSPPGKPQQEEDWPVLFPEKPTTPGTLQEMARQEGPYPLMQSSSTKDQQRHPVRANAESKIPSIHRKPLKSSSQSSSSLSFDRKTIEKSSVRNMQAPGHTKPTRIIASSSKNASETGSERDLRTVTPADKIQGDDMSSGAAAIEKSTFKPQNFSHPRQTRTSSLRARISAGSVVTEGPSSTTKVVGFTDFTTINESFTTTSTKGLHPRGGSRSPNCSPSPGRQAPNARGSVRPQRDRAPAKFAIRSRRPEVHLQSSSRTPSPAPGPRPPNRPAPAVPKIYERRQAGSAASGEASKLPVPGLRKSSLPVLGRTVPRPTDDHVGGAHISSNKESSPKKHQPINNNGVAVVEDLSTTDADVGTEDIEETEAVKASDPPTSCEYFGDCSNTTQSEEPITADEAIKDSPQRAVRIKRLSTKSPEHGPVLRISPSADRLILGIESGKENESAAKPRKTKDLHRAVVTKELRKASLETEQGATLKQTPLGRPFSAAGDLQLSSRHLMKDSNAREKKTKSADATYSLPTSHITQSSKPASRSKAGNSDDTVKGTDDPFFDANSQFEGAAGHNNGEGAITALGNAANAAATESAGTNDGEMLEEDSWISPMRNVSGSNRSSDTMLVTPAFLPVTLQEHLSGLYDDSNGERITSGSEAPRSSMTDCHRNSRVESIDSGTYIANKADITEDKLSWSPKATSTPHRLVRTSDSLSLNRYPPRSSSRTAVPNFTTTARPKTAQGTTRCIDPRLSKDFQPIQDKLGLSKGVPSNRIDPEASKSKRESSARGSNKTQGSMSKGMLSNFRGLFHKRSSDTTEAASLKSTKKGKRVAVTATGSPYPPISDVHPIHRPTLHCRNASTARPTTPDYLVRSPSGAITPSPHSPVLADMAATNNLVAQLCDSARRESAGPRKDRLMELSNFMVEAVTQAREAEMAMEEAKQAARRAEVSQARTRQSVMELTHMADVWRQKLETEM
ncbi:MAG: hypothetical protein M1830_003802 [Pleopsidium flavum]|nr:MAG: hypothetical protein M1830_003802 [Pleopsidium flavum]